MLPPPVMRVKSVCVIGTGRDTTLPDPIITSTSMSTGQANCAMRNVTLVAVAAATSTACTMVDPLLFAAMMGIHARPVSLEAVMK